jgi:uncharacterized damage-inducible protein DinB
MTHVEWLMKLTEETFTRTMRVAPLCPRDKLMWAPAAGALTLGQILRHMHRAERNRMKVLRGEMDTKEYYRLRHGNTTLESFLGEVADLDTELDAMRAAHAHTLDTLRGMTDADLQKLSPWGKGEVTRLAAVILMIEHNAHHRGQIATYLRILGVPNAKPYGT